MKPDGNKIACLFVFLLLIFIPLVYTPQLQAFVKHNPDIVIHASNETVRSVLGKFSIQSGVRFVFDDAAVEGKVITCNVSGPSASEVLNQLLQNTDLSAEWIEDDLVVLYKKDDQPDYLKDTKDSAFYAWNFAGIEPVLKKRGHYYYPGNAKSQGLEGTVATHLLVNESGDVEDVIILKSSGYELLDSAAENYIRGFKFSPAKNGDQPVKVWVAYELTYRLVSGKMFPENYVNTINSLRILYQKSDNKLDIEKRIIEAHVEFSSLTAELRGVNPNIYVNRVVGDTLYSQWKKWEKTRDLSFLLFHHFNISYPGSSWREMSIENLFIPLKDDLKQIIKNEGVLYEENSENHFISLVYGLVKEHYPEAVKTIQIN